MAWETRNGSGRYYTRSRRVEGRVTRQYLGSGLIGELAARQDQRERELRRLERVDQLEERERLDAITQVLGTLAAWSRLSMKEALEAAGCHCHRGQWRKQRLREVKAMNEEQALSQETPEQKATTQTLEAIKEGRPVSSHDVAELIKEFPFMTKYGDVARLVEKRLLGLIVGDNVLLLELGRSWLEETRQRLLEPGDGELERLLINRLSLNLLAVNYAETLRASKSTSLSEADFWDRRVSRLQNDLLKAARALREVRRLARPTLLAQMNIAEKQQINITAAPPPIEAADAE